MKRRGKAAHQAAGFTLVELMVVVAVVALMAAGASLALPDAAERALRQDASRLAAAAEVARARSRSTGQAVALRVEATGWLVQTPGVRSVAPTAWLHASTQATPVRLLLGPEPVIAAQRVLLLGAAGRQVAVATDGVRPFTLELP